LVPDDNIVGVVVEEGLDAIEVNVAMEDGGSKPYHIVN
jgi:hypothetical protein